MEVFGFLNFEVFEVSFGVGKIWALWGREIVGWYGLFWKEKYGGFYKEVNERLIKYYN